MCESLDIDETFEILRIGNKHVRVFPCGTIELQDKKEWIELVPTEVRIEPPYSLERSMNGCIEWMTVEIDGKQVPVMHLVAKAHHPDIKTGTHMNTLMIKYRNDDHKNCSIGNLIVRRTK